MYILTRVLPQREVGGICFHQCREYHNIIWSPTYIWQGGFDCVRNCMRLESGWRIISSELKWEKNGFNGVDIWGETFHDRRENYNGILTKPRSVFRQKKITKNAPTYAILCLCVKESRRLSVETSRPIYLHDIVLHLNTTNTAAKSITNQSSLNQLLLLTASAHQEGGFLVGSIETNRKDSPSGTPGTTQKTFTAEEPAPPPQQQQQFEKKDQDTASKSPWINFQTTDMPCIISAHGDASKTVPWALSDPTCEFDTR